MPLPERQNDHIDTMMVGSLVQQVEIEVLLGLCEMLADRAGIQRIDNLSIREWFQREKVAQMDNTLIGLEDTNPALAAKFQTIVDDCKQRLSKKSSDGK